MHTSVENIRAKTNMYLQRKVKWANGVGLFHSSYQVGLPCLISSPIG